MEIVVVGVNHSGAPVAVREMLAFTPTQVEGALSSLHKTLSECVLLSTCNRTEVYAVAPSAEEGRKRIAVFLASFHRFPPDHFAPFLFSLRGREAVQHLFSVASGLESMILGEPQVLGQVRGAFVAASAKGTAGPVLSRVFIQALKVGKRVRTETGISRSAVSISHAAVELAKRELGSLAGRSVLLVGAGDMGKLAARNLMDNGCTALTVANRTYGRAASLAAHFGAAAADLANLPELLAEADVAVTCTGAPSYVINRPMLEAVLSRRQGRPIILVDIAVPRDVEPEAARLEGAFVYDIDDLQGLCADNLLERQQAAGEARAIIASELEEFEKWWSSREVVPTITALRARAEEIRQAELRKALGRFGELSERDRSTLEALTSGIVNKILHLPTVRLKDCCRGDGGGIYALVLRELFALEDGRAPAPIRIQE